MKKITRILTETVGLVFLSIVSFSQCDVQNRIYPDGSILFYIEPVNFYWTESKDLKGGIVTDKESYFLALRPTPFPEKSQGKKLKADLALVLSDGNTYFFKHFDTRYMEKDTVMEMLYLIRQEDMESLRKYEVEQAKIDMMEEEGIRTYGFKLHKAALKEQLDCFLLEDEEGKKEE
jgi:hypothetical protein